MEQRTVLHSRLQEGIDAVGKVSQKINGVTSGMTDFQATVTTALGTMAHSVAQLQGGIDAIGNVSQKIDGVTVGISDVQASMATAFGTMSDRVAEVASTLGLIHTAILAVMGQPLPRPTQEAFDCIRVLNQVEDLVTDRDFQLRKNNAALAERYTERPTIECFTKLQNIDETLANRFQKIYVAFQAASVEARAERYLEIDALRREIVRRFGLSLPPSLGAGGGAQKHM